MAEGRSEMKLPKGIKHGGRCLTCRKWIVAATSAEWSKKIKAPCRRSGSI